MEKQDIPIKSAKQKPFLHCYYRRFTCICPKIRTFAA
jgi:hypothetical protein